MAQPTLLDTEKALAQIGDAETLQAMLGMFQEALAHDVPAICERLRAGDGPGANQLLHGLKGIVPIFCQAPLSDEIKRVELMSKKVQPSGMAELQAAYANLRLPLEQLLAEVTATLAN